MAVGEAEVQRWIESHEKSTADQRMPVLVL